VVAASVVIVVVPRIKSVNRLCKVSINLHSMGSNLLLWL
jgi:hypothetical protein